MARSSGKALQVVTPPAALIPVAMVDAARAFAQASHSENTRRAYRWDWQGFEDWCRAHAVSALPVEPQALALYLTHLAESGRKASGIDRALSAISQAHRAVDLPSPRGNAVVRAVMQGIRRTLGTAPDCKAPILVGDLRRMLEAIPEGLKGTRDRALLLVGFAGGFRRSELVGLDVADLAFGDDGLTVTLRRSKTDQEGAGRKVGLPLGSSPATCPVRALKAWLEASGTTGGAVFQGLTRHGALTGQRLSPIDVARVVKACAQAVGLDPERFAGHSLRAGLATSAAKAGKSERSIMAQTGHRSSAMVRRYIRDASLFSDNAASGIGL